ncbi:ribonuclease R [Elysia marginata]|uniref:Ribonuclease R n=1 Tax=Elysia marginata TaxID=1093978 RepID=A0AAV4FRA1_9GAST|nr:ribonuclease R [Elysia marginata]
MDEDEVLLQTFKDPDKEDALQGYVIKVLKRSREKFVGSIKKFGDKFGILPLDPRIRGKFRFINEDKLEEKQEVVVKIIEYGPHPKVELEMIIGVEGDASLDILASIYDSGVPFEFDPQTIKEAKQLPPNIDNENIDGRKDVRERLIVTIDGDDTKDFDDAISIEPELNMEPSILLMNMLQLMSSIEE